MKIATAGDRRLKGEAIQHFNCSTDMKTTGCKFVGSCWYHLLCCLVLIFGNYGSECKGQSPYRPFDPGNPSNPYGLTDLDHFSDAYDYCKWGNLLDSSVVNSTTLKFSWLTQYDAASAPPAVITDLFVSDSSTALNIVDLSSLASVSWVAPLGPSTPGRLNLTHQIGYPASFPTYLFRRLHFKNSLTDEVTNTTLGSDTSKVIVLIHGWNRTSDPTPYGEGNIEFPGLKTNLKVKLAGSGWKLVCYDWAADADTGGFVPDPTPLDGVRPNPTNPTKAAAIAHLHGQHLGELLASLSSTGSLKNVHLIAHSAGTWAARSATRYLTAMTNAKVQVTLLDPFIPGRMATNTSFTESVINQMPLMDGNNSGQLALLENYFAIDDQGDGNYYFDSDHTYYATSAVFQSWRIKDMNLNVDWNDGANTYYRRHSGPIQFYADTIWDPNLQVTASLQNQVFKGLTVGIGWKRSMFYQEPQITPQPSFSASIYSPGASPTLSSGARKRGENVTTGISFQWQILSSGTWTDIPSATSQNYTVSSVTTAMDGRQYRLVVSNDVGADVSNSVTLHVGTSGGTVPIRPTGLTATPVSSNQINLAWNDNSNSESGFIIQRKTGANGTYAAIATTPFPLPANTSAYFDTGLLQGATYFYQVIAAGSPNSDPSNEAAAVTPSNTGSVRILTLSSVNPASGVHLIIGPNDINGLADGNTAFSRQYTSAVTATVIAPATWNGNAFQKWQRDGQDWTTSTVANVFMDSSHTMTAIYAASTQSGTIYNIAVTAAPANGGTVTGTGTFASNATVSIQATAAPGYTFLNWTVNTSGANGGTTFAVQPQVSFPATANLSLVANFTQSGGYYNVTTTAEPPAGGTASGGGFYAASSNIPLSAQPAAGYVFDYWTENDAIISYVQSYQYPQISRSHNFVAHFRIPASGSAPDLFPKFILPQTTVFAGGTANRSVAILNQGTLSSNPFWFDFRISGSNTVLPEYGNLDFYAQRSFVGGNIPPGVEAGGSGSFTLPSNLAPGTYYMWMVLDPELASGEPAGNRGNNTTWQPLTVPPSPPASGPDLVPHDFTVAPAAVTVGGAINVNGAIRNSGNSASTACKYYISISTSPSIAPAKDALNTFGNVPALEIFTDTGVSSGLTLPGTFAAGNYYLWIMTDPDNTGGEPAGNRGNNNIVLPLTVLQPLQTFTVAASASPAAAGSVTGGGTYVSGAVVPLIVAPGVGYPFVNWTEGGIPVSTDLTYTFTAIGDRTLVANFLIENRVVTPSAGANGTISPSTPQNAPNGNSTTFTATPNANYRVNAWSVNGSLVQVGGTSFTVSNVTANTAVSVTFKPAALPAPGKLDTSFGSGGKVTTSIGTGDEWAFAVKMQNDGKILAAGYTKNGSNNDFALARYNTDGSLDTNFNGTGIVTTAFSNSNDQFNDLALQSDGKIVVAGFLGLARYNTNGSLDTSFNSTGKITTSIIVKSVAIQSDGKIVVAGYASVSGSNDFAVVRYNANGTLDTSFNGTGKVTTAIGSGGDIGYSLAVQSDGKIVVTGYSDLAVAGDRAFTTIRYNINGSLDTSFNGTGKAMADFGATTDEGRSVAVQSNGKIVVAGFGDAGRHVLLVRYNADGSLDTSFNSTGKLTTAVDGSGSLGYNVGFQSDGKILVAGSSGGYFLLLRYNANGTMDTSFNDNGKVTTDIGAGSDSAFSMSLQSDGKIVLAGAASNGSNNDIALVRYLARSEPDIFVEQPSNSSVANGSGKSFGSLNVGTTASLTFTIKNTGVADLTGLGITIDGTNAEDFTLTTSPTAPVSGPNGSTTFTVQFAPASAGAKTAALHIASNVADNSPFDITLTGSGNTPSESWRQQHFGTVANSGNAADMASPQHDSIPNLMKYATGMNPAQSGRMPGTAAKSGSNILFTYPRSKTALSSGVTYVVEWSDTLEANGWSSAGVTESSVVDQGATEDVTTNVPAGSNNRRFVRLKVIAAP